MAKRSPRGVSFLVAACIAAVGATVGAAPAFADEIRVPKEARTLQQAVRKARPGDTIRVRGTVRGDVVVSVSGIRIVGENARMRGELVIHGDDVDVSGFRFNGSGVESYGDGTTVRDGRFRSAEIALYGSGGVVSGNEIQGGDAFGIGVFGPGALVTDNEVDAVEGTGIYVGGADAEVTRNTVEDSGFFVPSIHVVGGDAFVSENHVSDAFGTGIQVEAWDGGGEIVDNVVAGADDVGIYVTGMDVVTDGFEVVATGSVGVLVDTFGGTVSDGTVTDTGADLMIVWGADTVVSDVTGSDADSEGIVLDGGATGSELVVSDVMSCGFLMGTGSTLLDSTATRCEGTGLQNIGSDVTVIRCTLTGNLPVDVMNAGTFMCFDANEFGTIGDSSGFVGFGEDGLVFLGIGIGD
ncbi:MAG: hypothetical protein HMLKMBBP_02183 [Planctomycetes bacterium]|nr:hypothetical protein [Planctomycetota bacterium]